MTRAFIGLGSNLGDRLDNLRIGTSAFDPSVVAVSPIYETEPWGLVDQPYFYNAVIEIDTDMSPHALLDVALAVELRAGRVRTVKNAPRTLDVDILWIEGIEVSDVDLTVPHPGLWERFTVLLPLRDIAPTMVPDKALHGLEGTCLRLDEIRIR